MKAFKFIRLLALLGIITLFVLQYAWFKNSYTLMEHDVIEKSQNVLTTAIEADLYNRINLKGDKRVKFSNKPFEGYNSNSASSIVDIDQSNDFNQVIQDFAILEGKPCNETDLDSIYTAQLKEIFDFTPSHTLTIVSDSVKEQGKTSKFTFYGKITNKQYAKVILKSPLGSILREAQLIVLISIILVVIIGVVLIYLLRSTLQEAKFVSFIKDYTHALTHELKTPISGIYIASSQLASGVLENKPEARLRYYEANRASSAKLLSTIDRILLVAKAERSAITTNPTETEVRPFIEKIADVQRNNTFRRKEVHITTECQPDNLVAGFDTFLMENVMNNLIDNAVKYSNQSVEIHVAAQMVDNYLEIRVRDNGFGIPENELKHVFDNFERGSAVKRKGIDGFGIGLNYVNKVVKAHKGKIRVESTVGIGSEFFIHLPQ